VKWIFIAGLLALVPILTGILRSQPKYLLHAAFAIGLLPFIVVPGLYVAPVSWAAWPGPVKGIEVSLLDAVALAVFLATPGVRVSLLVKLSFFALLFALLVSTLAGYQMMPAIFYIWQLGRAVLLFLAVARLCSSVPSAPLGVLAGMGSGLIYEAIYAVTQYASGDPRPGGNLGHSNFLGLASHFVVLPALALTLGGRRFFGPAAAVLAGLVIAIVGGSRATLGLFAIGATLTIVLSIWHKMTSRKLAIAGGASLLLLVAAPVMIWAANRRPEQMKVSSDEERSAMKLAARMVITDHPFGVGADQYVIVANTGGYSQRAGVPWSQANRSAPVHNVYYLVTAELGFLGLFSLIALLATFVVLGFRLLGRHWNDESSELIPGLLATMIIVCIHISYEWVFMHFVLHYLFAISTGLMVAFAARTRGSLSEAKPPAKPIIAPFHAA
jgi:O-antigen ligase